MCALICCGTHSRHRANSTSKYAEKAASFGGIGPSWRKTRARNNDTRHIDHRDILELL